MKRHCLLYKLIIESNMNNELQRIKDTKQLNKQTNNGIWVQLQDTVLDSGQTVNATSTESFTACD